jgi:hypothetical protein
MRRRLLKGLAGAVAVAASGFVPQAHSADFQREQRVGPMTVYVGVLPSELISPSLAEGQAHGGIPRGRGWHHVLIALFDTKTGQRITDAEVTARVEDVARIQSGEKRLEPMVIAGTVTFGNFFSMPAREALGLATFEEPRSTPFLGVDLPREAREYSERTARTIDHEIGRVLAQAHARVKQTLTEHRGHLEALAALLLEREVVDRAALQALLAGSEAADLRRVAFAKADE